MRSSFFIATLGSLASGFALPNFPVFPIGHEWIPGRPGDSEFTSTKTSSHAQRKLTGEFTGRSPCPGLNVLANHGYLPRNGRNIDLPTLQNAIVAAYNFDAHTYDSIFAQVQSSNLSTTGNSSTFNLHDVLKHGVMEFDGSLSRNDYALGDALNFDPKIWKTMSDRLALNEVTSDPMSKYVTVETAAKARLARVADAKKANKDFDASTLEMEGSPGTTTLYLTTLWDDSVGAVPKEWIKMFFGKSTSWLIAKCCAAELR